MKVTIIIPTRDRTVLLLESVQSALRQTLEPCEIIVVDDGSRDSSSRAVASLSEKIRYLHQLPGGKSRALNAGIALATGDAILVLDDDDLLPPYALAAHVSALSRAPDATFSFGRFQRFRGSPPTGPIREWPHVDVENVPTDDKRRTVIKLMEYCFLPNPTWMVRRTALDQAGPYDEAALRSQDFDMILRLARANDGTFVDDIVLYQRKHDVSRPGVLASTGGHDVMAGWAVHDHRIFSRIARTWQIEDFRPFQTAPMPAHEHRTTWLQKGVLLFPRKCFEEALQALETYRALLGDDTPDPVEVAVASSILRAQMDGALLDNQAVSHPVRRGLRNGCWPIQLGSAFVGGARWQIRAALKAGDRQRAVDITRFLLESFGPLAVAAGLSARRSLRPLYETSDGGPMHV